MKMPAFERRPAGFTLVEMLCVIAIIGILAALLMPALVLGKERAKRMVCVNNERQLGIAFHMFLHDHDNKFPMQVSARDGGAAEQVQAGLVQAGQFDFSYQLFQVLSNDSVVPRQLVCPTDTRAAAVNLARLSNSNLSYFVGVKADYNQPLSILAGDRNIAKQTYNQPSVESLDPGSHLYWTKELHRYKGDVLFADGHVEEWNQLRLTANTHGRVVHEVFFMPTVQVQVTVVGAGSGGGNLYNLPGVNPGPNADDGPPARPPGNARTAATGTSPAGNPTGATTTPDLTAASKPMLMAEAAPAANPDNTLATEGPGVAPGELGAAGGFAAFSQSGCWFWLFLLLLLAALAEAGRRWYKHTHPSADAAEDVDTRPPSYW
jgi:prepilin-type N-terminal cleavage/methylation domain-containing protein/prepilin-type processing-associated H-X9-DG protein